MASNDHARALVYKPLISITEDHSENMRNEWALNFSSASLTKLSAVEFKSADFQLLFGSAESALDDKFLGLEFQAQAPSFFVCSCCR